MIVTALPPLADWGAEQEAGKAVLLLAGLLLLWLLFGRRRR